MRAFRRIIRRRIRRAEHGVSVAGDIHGVVAVNVGEEGARTTSVNRERIVQRSGTDADRDRTEREGGEGR